MGKDRKQTTTQRLDPQSQRYVAGTRNLGAEGANAILNAGPLTAGIEGTPQEWMQSFLNPYIQQVIGGVGDQYDLARQRAAVAGSQGATGVAGAFGGSRHGVAEGVRMAELDRGQAMDVGQLLSQGFDTAMGRGLNFAEHQRQVRQEQMREPLLRYNAALGLRSGALGPVGQTTTNVQKGNLLSDVAGIGLMAAGAFTGNPGMVAGGAGALKGPSMSGPTGSSIMQGFDQRFPQGQGSFFNYPTASTMPSGLGMSGGMPGYSGYNPLSMWR
jgi:hypothetical protein